MGNFFYKTKLTESSVSEFYNFLSDRNPKTSGNSVGISSQITNPPPPPPSVLEKNRARSSPPINPLSKRPDLKATPPLTARSKKPNQAKLPSSPQPSTSTNHVPRPGTSFVDVLKSPTAPNRNSGWNTNFRKSKFDKFRHVSDKTQWRLPEITKKKPLLLGSSNLSKINLDKHPEVQVECYPGANFNHFRNLVTNYKGKSQPENIVVNIGINTRNQNGTSAVNQLRNMISSIRKRFPRAKIFFYRAGFFGPTFGK